MITTLSQLTDTVQEAEAEGWEVISNEDGTIRVYAGNPGLRAPDRIALSKDGRCQVLELAPWVDPEKMVRRTGT